MREVPPVTRPLWNSAGLGFVFETVQKLALPSSTSSLRSTYLYG